MKLAFPFTLGLCWALASAWPQVLAVPSLADYLGSYQLAPRAVLTVTEEAGHLYVRLLPQPRAEIFPDDQVGEFTLHAAQARISFQRDVTGRVSSLVLHQNGRDLLAARIEATEETASARPTPRTWPLLTTAPPRVLTDGSAGADDWPCFSPDGRSVLFARTRDGRNYTLMRAPAAGGLAEPFLKDAPASLSASRPSWSKGGKVAFTGEMDGSVDVWVTEANGSRARKISAPGLSGRMFYPSWYPDNQNIAAMDGANLVIRRFDLTGEPASAMTDRADVMTGMASVSPDGRLIAFAGQANQGQDYDQSHNILWLKKDSDTPRPLESEPRQGRAPVWSPDGKRLAFESDRGSADGRYAVYIIGRDGSGLIQVTDDALFAVHPVWSPDGRSLVVSLGGRRIAIIDGVSTP